MNGENVNPYAAPTEVTEPDLSLPEDTEFFFNDEVIASIGTLVLPKVCIITGEQNDLVEKQSTFRPFPAWCTGIPRALIFLTVVFGVTGLWVNSGPFWFRFMPLMAIWCVLAPVIYVVSRLPRTKLELTWYLSRAEILQQSNRHRQWRAVYFALGMFFLVLAVARKAPNDGPLLLIIVVTAGLILAVGNSRILTTAGRYKKLILVSGFRPPFIAALRRMLEQYEERHSHGFGKALVPEQDFSNHSSQARDSK